MLPLNAQTWCCCLNASRVVGASCARLCAYVAEIVGNCHVAAAVLLLLDPVAVAAVVCSNGHAHSKWVINDDHSRASACSRPNAADAALWSDIV